MSLDDGRMGGVMSANKPIDTEFCERVGMKRWGNHAWDICGDAARVDVMFGKVFVTDTEYDRASLPAVNTQGRFLHLLAAMGIEVPG